MNTQNASIRHHRCHVFTFALPWMAAICIIVPGKAMALEQPVGLWTFDGADPMQAALGKNLEPVNSVTYTQVEGINPGDKAILVKGGMPLRCRHGIGPNGGGNRVNAVTFVIDLKLQQAGQFPLIQAGASPVDEPTQKIDAQGRLGGRDTGYTTTGLNPGEWHRLAIVYSAVIQGERQYYYPDWCDYYYYEDCPLYYLENDRREIRYYIDGRKVLTASANWTLGGEDGNAVNGNDALMPDKSESLEPATSQTPWFLLFSGATSGNASAAVSSVAIYNRDLNDDEVGSLSTAYRTVTITPQPGSRTVNWSELFSLSDGSYPSIYVASVSDATGPLLLQNAVIAEGSLIAAESGAMIVTIADKVGIKFDLSDIRASQEGFTARGSFKLPYLLGGDEAEVDFEFTRSGGLKFDGLYINIPGEHRRGAFSIEKAYLEIRPKEGKYGGGGLFGFDDMERRVGGWIDLKTGIGPAGFDVTRFGLGEGNLNYAIGSTGAFLQEMDGSVQNDNGLSDVFNWGRSRFLGRFEITAGPEMSVAGTRVNAYKFAGNVVWNVHDGSATFDGTGKLVKVLELNSAKGRYNPPFSMDLTGAFNDPTGIFSGNANLHTSASGFGGSLGGNMSIPGSVPVIGGMSLGNVTASVDGGSIRGSATLNVAHGTKKVCHDVCHTVCPIPWVCDKICDNVCDWVTDFANVPFDFSFDPSSGSFSFYPHPPWGVFSTGPGTPFINWRSLQPAKASAVGAKAAGVLEKSFDMPAGAPAVVFRTVFENTNTTTVDMKVTSPSGTMLDSASGLLPLGYDSVHGFSRFNSAALEQAVVIVAPEPGIYSVKVTGTEMLGAVDVVGWVLDGPPKATITGVAGGARNGTFDVAYTCSDGTGVKSAGLLLAGRDGDGTGHRVASLDISAGCGGVYTLDTARLHVPAGRYFVVLEVDDGVNVPVKSFSDDLITVAPDAAPMPPSGIRFKARDGRFYISWEPSPMKGVIGYRILMRDDHEDLGDFNNAVYVPAGADERTGGTVNGLKNGEPLLVAVAAVGPDFRQSAPSEIVRIVPLGPAGTNPPEIVSAPDGNATAGYEYVYVPLFRAFEAADGFVWSLDAAPVGMTVDAATGVVRWTPAADQTGPQNMKLRLAVAGAAAGSYDVQEFSIFVYPANQPDGLMGHAYRFVSFPVLDVDEGSYYTYYPNVSGPGDNVSYRLLAGPEGMKIDPGTGFVEWYAPKGATGHRVKIQATTSDGNTLEQSYYLSAQRADQDPYASSSNNQNQSQAGCTCYAVSL